MAQTSPNGLSAQTYSWFSCLDVPYNSHDMLLSPGRRARSRKSMQEKTRVSSPEKIRIGDPPGWEEAKGKGTCPWQAASSLESPDGRYPNLLQRKQTQFAPWSTLLKGPCPRSVTPWTILMTTLPLLGFLWYHARGPKTQLPAIVPKNTGLLLSASPPISGGLEGKGNLPFTLYKIQG